MRFGVQQALIGWIFTIENAQNLRKIKDFRGFSYASDADFV